MKSRSNLAAVVPLLDTSTLQVNLPTSAEFDSEDCLMDHIAIMREFKCMLDDARVPGQNAQRYPKAPVGVTSEEDLAQWRVQSLLMSAEVRYSMYLVVLDKWCAKSSNHDDKESGNWPLPPWDVAIIFYCHLLTPFNFQRDMKLHFPRLWEENVRFPLSRLCSTVMKGASEAAWKQEFPDEPYQIIEFNADGRSSCVEHERLSTEDTVMDVRGFKCAMSKCPMYYGKVPVPMANYCQFRVCQTSLVCPLCRRPSKREKTGTDGLRITKEWHNGNYRMPRGGFDFPVFDLWEAPIRQFNDGGFADRVLGLQADSSTALVTTQAILRYLKFLQLLKAATPKTIVVPTLDIDLCWHTHQLSPRLYAKYCTQHIGRQINHDDTIPGSNRNTAQSDTAALWAMVYGESYFDPADSEKREHISKWKPDYARVHAEQVARLASFDEDNKHLHEQEEKAFAAKIHTVSVHEVEKTKVVGLQREYWTAVRTRNAIKPTMRLKIFRFEYYRGTKKAERNKWMNRVKELKTQCEEQLVVVGKLHVEREKTQSAASLASADVDQMMTERGKVLAELNAEVTAARDKVWRFAAGDNEKGWFVILPSEAQKCVHPVVGTRAKERKLKLYPFQQHSTAGDTSSSHTTYYHWGLIDFASHSAYCSYSYSGGYSDGGGCGGGGGGGGCGGGGCGGGGGGCGGGGCGGGCGGG